MVSKRSNKILQTWGPPFSPALNVLPIVEVVPGEHGAVCGVEVQPPDAVRVQQVHETGRGVADGGWMLSCVALHAALIFSDVCNFNSSELEVQ